MKKKTVASIIVGIGCAILGPGGLVINGGGVALSKFVCAAVGFFVTKGAAQTVEDIVNK